MIQFSKVIEDKAKNMVWDNGQPCDEKNIRSEIYSTSTTHCDPGAKMTKACLTPVTQKSSRMGGF